MGELVDVGRAKLAAVGAQVRKPHVVEQNDQHVGARVARRSARAAVARPVPGCAPARVPASRAPASHADASAVLHHASVSSEGRTRLFERFFRGQSEVMRTAMIFRRDRPDLSQPRQRLGLGIHYDDVAETLEVEGVQKFADSWKELLESVNRELAAFEGEAK